MIEAHGGSIAIASTIGRGTTVTLAFPAWRSVAATAAVRARGGVAA